MKTIARVWAFLGPILGLTANWAAAAEDSAPDPIKPLFVRAESYSIQPGAPLSTRTLVTHPPAIRGLLSWSIETRRHRGGLYWLSPSPNGQLLATGGLDGMVRVWKTADGQLLRVLVGHDSYSGSVAWSPCGTVLASTGTWDGTVRLWDPRTGRPLRVFKDLKSPVGHATWSADGQRLAASSGISGAVWLWDSKGDKTRTVAEVGHYISAIDWSPNGQTLAVLSSEANVSVLDMDPDNETQQKGRSFGEGATTCLAWSPDGQRLATGSSTHCTVWDFAAGQVVKKLDGACLAMAWSPDGTQLAASTSGYAVQIWDVEAGKVATPVPTPAVRLAWHPASQRLFCGYTTQFSVFDPAEKKVLLTVPAADFNPPYWSVNRPIVTGVMTAKLALWDATSAKHLCDLTGHTSIVSAVSWSRDGKTLASASYDKTVRLWDAAKGQSQQTLEGHTAAVSAVAWSPNGKLLASAGHDNTVRLWEADGDSCQVLAGHTGPVRAVVWSPMGNQLLSGGADQQVIVWDPKTRKSQRTIKVSQPVLSLACTTINNTVTLACGTTDEQLQIINAGNGQPLVTLQSGGSPPSVSALAWLPLGGRLFSGRGNHTAQLWDVGANKVVRSFQAMAPVVYATVAGNGNTLVAGNSDGAVRFWDTDSGELRGVILDCLDHIAQVTCDGQYRVDPSREPGLVFVALAPEGQLTLTPDEFAAKFHWRNNPVRVKMVPGR